MTDRETLRKLIARLERQACAVGWSVITSLRVQDEDQAATLREVEDDLDRQLKEARDELRARDSRTASQPGEEPLEIGGISDELAPNKHE